MSESRFRGLAALMTAVFVLSAAVQRNDPDPWGWIAIYGLAAVLSADAIFGRSSKWLNAAALALYVGLAAWWIPTLFDARPEAFTSFEMKEASDEAPREAGGLLLCAAWSAYLTWRAWHHAGAASSVMPPKASRKKRHQRHGTSVVAPALWHRRCVSGGGGRRRR